MNVNDKNLIEIKLNYDNKEEEIEKLIEEGKKYKEIIEKEMNEKEIKINKLLSENERIKRRK